MSELTTIDTKEDGNKNLVKKLAHVMREVKYIQKRGRNTHFGYTYATEADVAEKVREALADQNVIMLPSVIGYSFRETTTAKGRTEFICTVDMEFTFHDGDSGENLTIKMSGDGQDSGDKAIFKAITGCTKYAQMKSFMIPTGDDPEDDNGGRDDKKHSVATKSSLKQKPQSKADAATEAQLKKLYAMSRELGIDKETMTATMQELYGKNSSKELTKKEASGLIEYLSDPTNVFEGKEVAVEDVPDLDEGQTSLL